MVSFKPQTKTLSRGPVLEVGDALSTWPPSAHHTLAHMHGPLPPPWVRGWQTSLVTGGWLLPTGAGSPPWEATGPWGAIPSMNLGSHGFPPPPTEPGLQNFYSLHCVALLSIWSLKQGREMRIMVSMCVQKGHWAAPGMHNSQVRPGAGGLAREGCMCASPLGSQNL